MASRFGSPELLILADLCSRYGRPIDRWADDGAGNMTAVFVPPLSSAEQATFADLQTMANFGLQTLTLAAYQARKADVQGLVNYMALANPTAAQTQAAFKALVRVCGAMFKMQLNGG